MTQAFETIQQNIAKQFSSDYIYEFPPYQRPYRWTIDNAMKLLNDIALAAQEQNEGDDYFLGSIVLIREGSNKYSVVDGRQRLTTLFIMLAVLRDISIDPALKHEIHQLLYDKPNISMSRPESLRLIVGESDTAFFSKYVADQGATQRPLPSLEDLPERQKNVANVVDSFKRRFQSWTTTNPLLSLQTLITFVLKKCVLITIVAGNQSQGLRLFEVLNNRGLPLSQADLMKPSLFKGLDAVTQQKAADAWDYMDSSLSTTTSNRLLRSLCFILGRLWVAPENPNTQVLVDIIRKSDIAKFHTDALPCYVDSMRQIESRDLPCSDDAKDPNILIQALSWIGRSDREFQEWLPVALEIVSRTQEDESRRFELLAGLERSFYILLINNVDETKRRNLAAQAIQQFRDGIDPLSPPGALVVPASAIASAKKAIRSNFDRLYVRGALTRRAEVALCQHLNASLLPELDDATAEHVLPQHPNRRSEWSDNFRGPAFNAHLNLIGNATLLNRRFDRNAANKEFADKKKLYMKYRTHQTFQLTRDVCAYPKWTQQEIIERTEKLAQLLEKSWGI